MSARRDSRTPPALVRQRARMDRLNARLCDLLQQRARLAIAISRWKAARGLPVADPARERAMLAAMLATPGPGFAPAALRRLLQAILRESRAAAVAATQARGVAARPRTAHSHPTRSTAPRHRRRPRS
jgi:chorismate mutase